MANNNSLIININGNAKDFLDEIDKAKKKTESLDKTLTATAKTSAAAFAAFAGTIALATKAFADYETALVGVGKTTNIQGKNLENFGKQFQKLSSQIPLSTNELLGIAQAAGQLGVSGEQNLLVFTETIAKLGVATDLTGEQAATALTRILNVTGESISTIDNFGSVIVRLGNNFAATESEIVGVANEVARSTAVFGVSAAEAAGLAAALKSVGVQAQLGGSVTGKAFRTIEEVIRNGGPALENLARLTGIAGDQLKQTFQDDATTVFQSFIEGLGQVEQNGGSVSATLETFGLIGDEVNKILPVLAKNSGLLGDALGQAADEAANATALNEEARQAFNTLNSEFQILSNNAVSAATSLGAKFAPEISSLLKSVNGLLASIQDLDDETVSSIATFIKWGTVISAGVTAIAGFLLAVTKVSAIIAGLSSVFLPATVAASAFWVAVTGPIGLAVAGLAAVTAGAVALYNAFDKGDAGKSIDEINKKLEDQRQALERNKQIALDTGKDPNQSVAVQQIQERIDKLEELRKKKIEAANTPLDLTRPTDGIDAIEAPTIAGIEEQTIPFAPEVAGGTPETGADNSAENLKASEDKKLEIVDEATQKRIDLAKQANDQLKALQAERTAGATEEELKLLQRRQEIQSEFTAAEQIKNEEERQLALENLNLKHEAELAQIDEFEAAKDERAAQRREERAALDAELRELDLEQRALYDEEDKALLAEKLLTDQEIEQQFADEALNRRIKERNQFLKDEKKFGTALATVKQFANKEEVQGAKDAAGQLVQLTNSKNSTLKTIGKAAARTNAAIATAEGAIKAYTSLAGIPIVGPALGAAAAASLVAFGVEQQSQISALQTGGFVPNAVGGARDRVPALLEPNELVVPAAVAPNFIQAAGIPDTQADEAVGDRSESGAGGTLEIVLEDRAGEFISLEQREGRSLGLIGAQ